MEEEGDRQITASDLSVSCPPSMSPCSTGGNSNHPVGHSRKLSGTQRISLSIQPAENTPEVCPFSILVFTIRHNELHYCDTITQTRMMDLRGLHVIKTV